MLEDLGRTKRDSALIQIAARQLRDFIVPDHLLTRINSQRRPL